MSDEKSIVSTRQQMAKRTIQGTIWVYVSTYSGKSLVFLSTIILARLLTQEDYGVAGYALVVISFLDVLEGLGIQAALIYHRRTPERMTTAFWLGLFVGIALFLLSWLIAPLAGWFFRDPQAVPVIRILSLTFPISAFGIVHDALLRKDMAFKRKFIPEFGRTMAKGVVSVVLALLGFGAWSLILGQLAGTFVSVIMLWFIVPWRPHLKFYRDMVNTLLSYGTRIVMVNGLGILLLNLDYLLIGRYLGSAALGVYTLAFRVPELLIKQFSDILGKVIFPAYAKIREEGGKLNQGFLVTLQYVNLVTVPLGLGLALTSEPFVLTFFTGKWVDAIPVMQAIALYTLLRAMVFNTGDVYKAQGRPELMVKIKFWQAVVSMPALYWASVQVETITAVAWTQVGLVLVAGIVKLEVAVRMLDTPRVDVLRALRPSFLAGGIMSVVVLIAQLYVSAWHPFWQLTFLAGIGGLTYAGVLWFSERQLILEALQTFRVALKRRKKVSSS